MIIQTINDKLQIVYVKNSKSEYMQVAKQLGLCNQNGTLVSYANIQDGFFTNDLGIKCHAYLIIGKTYMTYVTNDTIYSNSNNANDICTLFNSFGSKNEIICNNNIYIPKFNSYSAYMITDKNKKGIGFCDDSMKNIEGINYIMTNLDLNNGKLLEPIIARYVYTTRRIKLKTLPFIGYVNLYEYLKLIQSSGIEYFFRHGRNNYDTYIKLDKSNIIGLTVKSCNNGVLKSEINSVLSITNAKEHNDYNPYIMFSLTPIKIVNSTFPWKKVNFEGTSVFLIPVFMNDPQVLESLRAGIDLIAN
jgi:hypothetical protein